MQTKRGWLLLSTFFIEHLIIQGGISLLGDPLILARGWHDKRINLGTVSAMYQQVDDTAVNRFFIGRKPRQQ